MLEQRIERVPLWPRNTRRVAEGALAGQGRPRYVGFAVAEAPARQALRSGTVVRTPRQARKALSAALGAMTMQSIDLIRLNLRKSRHLALARVEEMRDHSTVFPTRNGGCHTLWTLGHLAYIETLVIRTFMLGEENPLAQWAETFDGADTSGDISQFPPFDDVLAKCREVREQTVALLDSLSEGDLDRVSAQVPEGFEDTFGTYRDCLQYVADHWYMHRGNLADARRAAGLGRTWV